MQKQQGAALIIVLVLLSVSLVIGMSGMNAALVDERLAGNYRASALAQMNAERAASVSVVNDILIGSGSQEFWNSQPGRNLLRENLEEIIESDKDIDNWKDVVRGFRYEDVRKEFYNVSQYNENICNDNYNRCLYFPVYIEIESEAPEWYIVAFGAIESKQNDIIAQSQPIFIKLSNIGFGESGNIASNQGLTSLLGKIIESGNLVNVLDSYEFSSSNNSEARSWADKISSDDTLFESPEVACAFKDALINEDIAKGLVRVVSGNVNGKGFSELSGNIVVVNEDNFSLPNASDFNGVLIVFGLDFKITGGGNINFGGAIVHVPVDCSSNQFDTPRIDVRGGNGNYNLSAVQSIINSLDESSEEGGGVNSDYNLIIADWQ